MASFPGGAVSSVRTVLFLSITLKSFLSSEFVWELGFLASKVKACDNSWVDVWYSGALVLLIVVSTEHANRAISSASWKVFGCLNNTVLRTSGRNPWTK